MISNPKTLFLIDSLGALLTAFFLSVILANLEAYFGMPKKILYLLSSVALMYAIYSICCYYFIKRNWKPYLKIIVIANIVYTILTIGIVTYFYNRLTGIGVFYFLLEVIVLIILIRIEIRAIVKMTK
ncbi:hypothetical protein [Aquimarina mytili]|uniref:Uncharacterized protein n=1 Tax=Aquimarina mytili TaxID=874423 RepID=A0A936ZV19_9FLAO|nr:hypothetical protein [Aquimarina mytili]MBL0682701.1 hypothetical protein [Aquimarina mytili]